MGIRGHKRKEEGVEYNNPADVRRNRLHVLVFNNDIFQLVGIGCLLFSI